MLWNTLMAHGLLRVTGGTRHSGVLSNGISSRAHRTIHCSAAASCATSCRTNGRWRRSMTERYVELHAASAFSFLEGASQPESLIERAVELEMPAMALLDRNGVYGSARFHTSAKRNDIRAHVGAEICGVELRSAAQRRPPGCRISTLPSRLVCLCSASPAKAIRISASSLRSSKCGRRRSRRARLTSMI